MEARIERRRSSPGLDDALSPEALALLVSCGGDIRASDRAAISKAGLDPAPDRRSDDRRGQDRRYNERRAIAGRNEKPV